MECEIEQTLQLEQNTGAAKTDLSGARRMPKLRQRLVANMDQRPAPVRQLWPKAVAAKRAGGGAGFHAQGRGDVRGRRVVKSRTTQRGRILRLLQECSNQWVPSYELAAIALQYGARVYELRKQGYLIENKAQDINGQTHGAFRLVPAGAQAKLFDLETLPAPMQAEERAAGGNITAFLPPASPSLSLESRSRRHLSVLTHSPRPWYKDALETHEGATRR